MRYCKNCGESLSDDAKFCPSCGAKFTEETQQQQQGYQPPTQEQPNDNNWQQVPPEQPNYQQNPNYIPYDQYNYYQQPIQDKPSGKLNTAMLVWAIINTVSCCQLLGIIALIFTISANSTATLAEETQKLKTAKILNLIGTISGVVIIIFYIILIVSGVWKPFNFINY